MSIYKLHVFLHTQIIFVQIRAAPSTNPTQNLRRSKYYFSRSYFYYRWVGRLSLKFVFWLLSWLVACLLSSNKELREEFWLLSELSWGAKHSQYWVLIGWYSSARGAMVKWIIFFPDAVFTGNAKSWWLWRQSSTKTLDLKVKFLVLLFSHLNSYSKQKNFPGDHYWIIPSNISDIYLFCIWRVPILGAPLRDNFQK